MANAMPPRPIRSTAAARLPAAVYLMVEPQKDGGYRLSTPHARGWAAHARTPNELARHIANALVEVQVAAYARAHGKVYDLDAMTVSVPGDVLAFGPVPREKPVRTSRRSHSPADWAMTDDGRWRSPGGRLYGADQPVVQRVIAKRQNMGLPTT